MNIWLYLAIAVAIIVLFNVLLVLYFIVLNHRSQHDQDYVD